MPGFLTKKDVPYEILKHTADLRMRAWGDTLESLFLDATRGMMGIMKKSQAPMPNDQSSEVKRIVSVQAGDRTALLVDFLNEILTLAQTNKEIYLAIALKGLSETEVEAELDGAPVENFDEDIKAVTYHEAEVKQNKKGEWETMLVFDI